jgi:hypothetical protein
MTSGGGRERVVTAGERNRSVLARQLLLERARLPLPRALERVAGLQMQYAPSGYLGLWTRVEGFRRRDLTVALERRRAVQATLLRSTIHLTSARDFALMLAAIREPRRAWMLRVRKDLDPRALAATARRVRRFLEGGPRTRDELLERFSLDGSAWNALGLWLDLVRVPPSGTWERRRADRFALADAWLGPSEATEAEGLAHLVRRYLAAFGPASTKEIATWAGLPVAAVGSALEGMRLRSLRAEEGDALIDLPRSPVPPADAPAPVRFLPTWDATLLVHARRARILREEDRPRVFDTKTPHSFPTFLVDGQVRGTWSERDGRVRIEPFAPLPRRARRAVEEEADLLRGWLDAGD